VTELIATGQRNQHSGGRQQQTASGPTRKRRGNSDRIVCLRRVPQHDTVDQEIPAGGIGQRLTERVWIKCLAVKEI
jgi:hypothetical protein